MKRRTNITINESIYAKAQELMALSAFSDFSGFVEQLIRDEWARKYPVRPICSLGDILPQVEAEVAATICGNQLNEGECLSAEQLAAQAIAHARDTAAAPVSYAPPAKKRAKKPPVP
jgi:hypothetical protein